MRGWGDKAIRDLPAWGMMSSGGETLDVVDAGDDPVGAASRRRVHKEGLLHRAVHVLLFDAEDRLLLQQRSETKRTYPGLWTSSASGHVEAGEDPSVAARREVDEELGIAAPPLAFLGRVRFEDDDAGEREIMHVFTGRVQGANLDPDPSEVQGTRWVPLGRLEAWMRDAPDHFAASFGPVLEHARDRVEMLREGA